MTSSTSFAAYLTVAFGMFGLTQCKDPDPSRRSLPSSADVQANCLTGNTALTSTSWQGGIGTIFINNCGSCHSAQSKNYTLYADVKSNIASIATKIQNGSMPKNQAWKTATDKDAISAWILAGYPETDSSVVATPTPSGGVTPTASVDPYAVPDTSTTTPAATNCIPASSPASSAATPSPTASGGLASPTPTPTY